MMPSVKFIKRFPLRFAFCLFFTGCVERRTWKNGKFWPFWQRMHECDILHATKFGEWTTWRSLKESHVGLYICILMKCLFFSVYFHFHSKTSLYNTINSVRWSLQTFFPNLWGDFCGWLRFVALLSKQSTCSLISCSTEWFSRKSTSRLRKS